MSVDESLFGMPAEKGRWGLIVLGMIINLCLGTIYSWSVFVGPLTTYFSTTLSQTVTANEILMPFSVFLAFFAIAMPLTGKYIETLGPRKVTIIGGILTGLGWLLASTVTSVWMLYIVYGVIGGIGVGIAYGVPVAVAARWFPDRRGTAVGLTLLGFGFSAFLTANIAGYFLNTAGVMNTFRIFGVAFIILIVLLALPLRFPVAGWKPAGWTPPVPKPGEEICECNRSAMIRTPAFYGLWVCFFIGCLAGLMAISISKPVGTDIGIATGLATFLVGFFAIFNGGGRPVFGALTDRLTPRNTALLSFILIAAASTLLWQMPSVPVYIFSFAILWGCLGGWLAIAPTATGSYFGTCDYPRCYGVVFLAYGAGAIAGPQLAGFILVYSRMCWSSP
jgi:OFA family oxalate/formate antiporter-like MFS transporter